MPSARFPAYPLKEPVAEIFSVSPYPVPLMEMGEVSATELLVHGQNFNHSQLVVAVIDGKESKLKTLFVSPDELHAWLPAKYWSLQKLRYRFVLHSNEGSCVAEIVDQDD